MAPTDTRWEWRVFGDGLDVAADRFASGQFLGEESSDELYLLSAACRDGIKIRRGRLEIKRLERVEQGAQRWRPVLSSAFPVGTSVLGTIIATLELSHMPLPKASLDERETINLLGHHPDTLSIAVSKQRRRFLVQRCLAEVTDLEVLGQKVGTVALECGNLDRLISAKDAQGLAGIANESYPAFLRRLAHL